MRSPLTKLWLRHRKEVKMIHDVRTQFCRNTSAAGTAASTLVGDVIDLGPNQRDPGNGQPVYLVIVVKTAIATGGSAGTIAFQLRSDATGAIDPSTGTLHVTTPTFVTDDDPVIPVGTVLYMGALPVEGNVYERYLGIIRVIGATTTTAGAIDAFLTLDPKGWKSYPDGAN
jgi:hypothetical protein